MAKEEEKEEALVHEIDVKVLHRRVGQLGKVGMERKSLEEGAGSPLGPAKGWG